MIAISKNDVVFLKRTGLLETAHHQRSSCNFNRVCIFCSAGGATAVIAKRTGLDRNKNFAKAIAAKNQRHRRTA